MKKVILALSLLMVVILAGGVLAEEPAKGPAPGAGPGPGRGMGMGPGFGQHMRWWENPQLNLTPEQKTKLDAQFQTYQQEVIPLRNSMREKREEVESLLGQTQLDKDKILAKTKEFIAIQNILEEKRINFEIAQRLLLTPEQRSLIGSMRPRFAPPAGTNK